MFSLSIHRHFLIYLTIMVWLSSGCSLMNQQAKKEQRLLAIKEKKENFERLHSQIISQKLEKGRSKSDIQSDFGEPDNIFRSGSSVSSMEIWAYEKVLEKGEEDNWQTIRLYFDNDKLITWQF